VQARRAQTRTSTVTPRRCSLSAAWRATRLSRAREPTLPRGVEVEVAMEPTLPRKALGSKHDESSYLTRLNRDRQLAGEVYVNMSSSLVCGFLWQ
jgi:hypothetical protein